MHTAEGWAEILKMARDLRSADGCGEPPELKLAREYALTPDGQAEIAKLAAELEGD